MVMVYQYIGVLIGIIGIIFTLLRFREGKMSLGMLLVWNIIWILIIIISNLPQSTGNLTLTGVGRGLDLIFILGIIGCYYLIFKIYNMIENIEQEITHLEREIALQRENMELKEDEEN